MHTTADPELTTSGITLLDVPQAADALSVSRAKLYQLMKANEVAVVKIGRRSLIRRDSLDAFIERQTRR